MLDTVADKLATFGLLAATFAASSVMAAPRGATEAARRGKPVSAVIDGRLWACSETGCRAGASSAADSQPLLRECRRAAARLGVFDSYSTGDRALSAEELVLCNRSAPANAQTLATSR